MEKGASVQTHRAERGGALSASKLLPHAHNREPALKADVHSLEATFKSPLAIGGYPHELGCHGVHHGRLERDYLY